MDMLHIQLKHHYNTLHRDPELRETVAISLFEAEYMAFSKAHRTTQNIHLLQMVNQEQAEAILHYGRTAGEL